MSIVNLKHLVGMEMPPLMNLAKEEEPEMKVPEKFKDRYTDYEWDKKHNIKWYNWEEAKKGIVQPGEMDPFCVLDETCDEYPPPRSHSDDEEIQAKLDAEERRRGPTFADVGECENNFNEWGNEWDAFRCVMYKGTDNAGKDVYDYDYKTEKAKYDQWKLHPGTEQSDWANYPEVKPRLAMLIL